MPTLDDTRITRGGIHAHVREMLDVDEDDITDTMLDRWIIQGFRRIIRVTWNWRGYRQVEDFTTADGVQFYDATAIRVLRSVGYKDEHQPAITLIENTKAHQTYGTVARGEPRHFSVVDIPATRVARTYLWPVPNGAHALFRDGFRDPTNWYTAADADVPDFDPSFDDVLMSWVLSQAYLREDEPEQYQLHRQQFIEQLNEVATWVLSSEVEADVANHIMAGGDGVSTGPQSPSWPWAAYGEA